MAAMAAFTFSSCEDVPSPYDLPNKPETPDTPAAEPTGTGTQTDPFNVAGAVKYIEDGGSEDAEVYVKGKVVSVKEGSYDASYGSLKYYISDDGTTSNQFYVFNGYAGPNRTKFSGEDALKAGDEVVICGKLVNYSGTKEFTTGNYVVTVNGQPIGGGDKPDTPSTNPKGTGTAADPFNSVAAQNYAAALEADKATDQEFYIKGKIQKFANNGEFNASYGNASFYIADDASSEQFYIFRTYYFGGEKWKEGDQQLKVGDEVVVCAKLINYKGNTPETNQGGKLISVNGKTSGGSSTPDTPAPSAGVTISGTTVTLSSGATAGEKIKVDFSTLGYENQQTVETIKLSDGTTITFDANGETNGPKYYTATKGIRVYKNNKIIFNGKSNIAQIIMTCDSYNGTDYVGNATATVAFSGKTATYTNVFTGTTGGGVQLRVKAIEIVYAK